MTYETCIKQAENCRKHGDEAGARIYEERAERKLKKPQYANHPENLKIKAKAKDNSKDKEAK